MDYKLNPNLVTLHKAFISRKSGAVLEGGSRSGKTWSGIDFLIWLCSNVHYVGSKHGTCTINIIKETYNSFKTTLYDDFNRRLPDYGIPSPFMDRKDVSTFWLWGNRINLLGADNETVHQGVSSDYFWINEALDVSNYVFDQAEMRCRRFWWIDYNPKVVEHWVYDKVCNRSDVLHTVTTLLDNPAISKAEKRKILSYEPTHPDDRALDVDKRRPHPTNVANGTADDYMWRVYGLGERAAPEGIIFQNVKWVKEFPTDVDKVYYGMDFGYTNSPTALVRIAPTGPPSEGGKLFMQQLIYQPTESSTKLLPLLEDCVKAKLLDRRDALWCDSSGDEMITGLRANKWRAFGVNKYKGSIEFGIALLKRYSLHIVDCHHWRKEQSLYKWREVNGIRLDEPVDEHNHLWDAARYAALQNLRHVA